MSNLEIKIVKTDNGVKAVTDYKIADVADGSRVLRIETRKCLFRKGKVMTSASVHRARAVAGGLVEEMHACGLGSGLGDFSATVEVVACPRATEKFIYNMHEANLERFSDILSRAIAHYERQVANA